MYFSIRRSLPAQPEPNTFWIDRTLVVRVIKRRSTKTLFLERAFILFQVNQWKNRMSPELIEKFDKWIEKNTEGTDFEFYLNCKP